MMVKPCELYPEKWLVRKNKLWKHVKWNW